MNDIDALNAARYLRDYCNDKRCDYCIFYKDIKGCTFRLGIPELWELKGDGEDGEAIKVMLDEGASMPERAHEADAGWDLRTPLNVKVPARGSATIDTGIHIAIPYGYAGFLKSKSGLNVKNGLTGEGVIDSGYTGSICVKLYNQTDTDHYFKRGEKLIQIVIAPVHTGIMTLVESLDETERGNNGFGSTGK